MASGVPQRRIHLRGRHPVNGSLRRPPHSSCRLQMWMGHREDVKVHVQRRQSGRHRRAVRCRHAASVRDVPRSGRGKQALGHERHRRLFPLPQEVLEALPAGTRRQRAVKGVAQERPQAHQESDRRHRTVLLQHGHLGFHDLRERTRTAEVCQP